MNDAAAATPASKRGRDPKDYRRREAQPPATPPPPASGTTDDGDGGSGRGTHLRLAPLAVLVFYNVSGGPFGIEAAVRAGGNLYAILGFVLLPLVWSVPEALITAELGSAYPEAGGGMAWVEEAFGTKAGLACGYLSWVAGATDNAIYPSLFLEYATSILEPTASDDGGGGRGVSVDEGWSRFAFITALSLILAGINCTGLQIVGTGSVVVCVVSMSPFVVMCLFGIPQLHPSQWFQTPDRDRTTADLLFDGGMTEAELLPGPVPLVGPGGVVWRVLLNNLFWNLNSFDSAASFAGEVRGSELATTWPHGMLLGLGMVYIGYLLPLLVATGATASTDWADGHLATVAAEIAGPWLGHWVVFAAGVSNLALFEAEMSSDAYLLMGMAERGALPQRLAGRGSHSGAPLYGIAIGTAMVVAMGALDLSRLIESLNVVYGLSLIMEYAAFVKLRWRGDFSGQSLTFRMPGRRWAAALLVLPPCALTLALFCFASWATYAWTATVLTLGAVIHGALVIARRRQWCDFAPPPPVRRSQGGVGAGAAAAAEAEIEMLWPASTAP